MKSLATASLISLALFAFVCDANDQFYGNDIGNMKFKNLDEAADYVAKNVDDVMSAGNESGALYLNCTDGFVRLAGYIQGGHDNVDFGPAVESVKSKSLFTGKKYTCVIAGTVHTHPWAINLDVDDKTGSLKMNATAYGASQMDFQNLLKYGRMDIVDQRTKDIVSYRKEDGVVVSYKKRQGERKYTQCDKYCFDESGLRKLKIPTINGSLEVALNRVIDPNDPSSWNDGAPVEGKPQTKENSAAVQTDSGILNKDVLNSLMKFGETLEEDFEVREDMREKRRERKAREQAERERKAAEEPERLRQQQLAAQRKQNQKRESETKSNKATTRETPKSTATSQSKPAQKSTTPTQTKQTTTVTTQPKQTVSASFDMSKLTSIYEKRMAVLEEIYALPDGETASADQRQKVNAYLDEYKAELSRLEKVLDNGPKNNTWFNYGLKLNIKKDGQTTLMTRMMQRCRNAGKF